MVNQFEPGLIKIPDFYAELSALGSPYCPSHALGKGIYELRTLHKKLSDLFVPSSLW